MVQSLLPEALLVGLEDLVDRLNAASGFAESSSAAGGAAPIRALLVGTNEGVGLARLLAGGEDHNNNSMQPPHIYSAMESVWSTLVSSCPPVVSLTSSQHQSNPSSDDQQEDQPPHPLLEPLGMGGQIRTVTAFYDNITLLHIHAAPLVVTVLATPTANIGSIKSTAVPILRTVLEPIRIYLLQSRGLAFSAAGQQQQAQIMQQQQQQYYSQEAYPPHNPQQQHSQQQLHLQ